MALTDIGKLIASLPTNSNPDSADYTVVVDPETKAPSKTAMSSIGGGGVFYGDIGSLASSSNRSGFPVDTQGVLVEISSLPGGASVDDIFYFNSPNAGKYLKLIINGPIRAANCGVKAANSAATNSSRLQAAFNNAGVREIVFDEPAGTAIPLTGTITIPVGKVLTFKQSNRITGTCTLSGGIIRAEKTQHIFDTTVTVLPEGSTSGEFSVKWYGAVGNNSTDDTAAIQASIDACINSKNIGVVRFPYGYYVTSNGLLIKSVQPVGQQTPFTQLTLMGEVSGYDADGAIGATSGINCNHTDNFAIGVQRGKGCVIENLVIRGRNFQDLTFAQVIAGGTAWVINGCRDHQVSPYSAIVIDPFGQSSVPEGSRYPRFTSYYTEINNGGSTDIRINNCVIWGFVVGVCISPSGTQQNAELIKVDNCTIERGVRSCVTTGNTQTRTVWVRNFRCWGSTECVIDSVRYGGGGAAAELIGANIAGGVKYLTLNATAGIPYAKFTDVYAESLYAIGGDFFAATPATQAWFTNCEIKLMGGESNTSPMTMLLRFNMCSMVNCIVAYYATSLSMPYPIECINMSLYQCKISGIFQDIDDNPVAYKNCKVIGFFDTQLSNNEYVLSPSIENGRMIVAQGGKIKYPYLEREFRNGPLISVVEFVDTTINIIDSTTISFNAGSANINSILVGDVCLFMGASGADYTDPTSLASGKNFVLGKVSNVNTGTNVVTVNNVSVNYVLVNGNSYRFKIVTYATVYKTHIGDITSGTNTITNVVGEGNSTTVTIQVGDFVIHPAFAQSPAARVTAVAGSTVTVNKNANSTHASAAIVASEYRASLISNKTDVLAQTFKVAWRKGDIIINDYKYISSPNDNNVYVWVCTESGIINSSNLPEFTPVNVTP